VSKGENKGRSRFSKNKTNKQTKPKKPTNHPPSKKEKTNHQNTVVSACWFM